MVAAAAIAASSALPPLRSAARPASEARRCGLATSPPVARASGQRVVPVTPGILQRHAVVLGGGQSLTRVPAWRPVGGRRARGKASLGRAIYAPLFCSSWRAPGGGGLARRRAC